MRKLYTIILISLLAASSRADDLASSFKQAACLAAAQEKESAIQKYIQRDVRPYYLQKYGPIFQSCLKSTDRPDTSTFSFVAAIGEDGRVLRLYVDHETNIFACARQTLQQGEFPHPPLSPFYWSVSMSFSTDEEALSHSPSYPPNVSSQDSDLASSFKQAAALGEAQKKEPAAEAYVRGDLMPYYQQKYSPVFQSCLASTDQPDTTPFSFVLAIGKDGRVLRLYIDHETNIFACVRRTLQQEEFPHPPVSPYYLHVTMSFQ